MLEGERASTCSKVCACRMQNVQRCVLQLQHLPAPASSRLRARRFMGIAEQMGRVLQRTSISVNIKERLDFSCALFGPDGALVANAPHLPVHLGAMSEAVRYQVCSRVPAGGLSPHPQVY